MIILAIDPGITGALAFYDTAFPSYVKVTDMPIVDGDVNAYEVYTHVYNSAPHIAIIEHVHPHPKEGVSSVWRFAAAYTTVCVVVRLLKIPLILVSPAKWKSAMRLKGGAEGKETSRRVAIDTFPAEAQRFSRKKDHGRAEAALLAVYAASLPTLRNHHEQRPQGQASPADGAVD